MPDRSQTASRSDSGGDDRSGTDDRGFGGRQPDSDGSGDRAPDDGAGDPGGHDRQGPEPRGRDTDDPDVDDVDGTDSHDGTDRPGDSEDSDTSDDPDDTDGTDAHSDSHGDCDSHDGTDDVDTTDHPDDHDTADRFRKLDGAAYDHVNDFLRDHVEFTAREWAVARLCADFRTGTGVPMTTVGEHLPELVPFVTEPYSRQAVYGARRSFADRVRRAAATFLYGAAAGFLTAEEVDDVLYEATEVATLLLEVEGTSLSLDDETAVEERTVAAMRAVHEASLAVRYDECPECGARLGDDAT